MKHLFHAIGILLVVIIFVIISSSSKGRDFTVWPGNIEKPPIEYSTGDFSATTIFIDDFDKIDEYCQTQLGVLPFNAKYLGCYIPITNTIVAPTQNGDYVRRAILLHEQAHARGWRHIIPKEW